MKNHIIKKSIGLICMAWIALAAQHSALGFSEGGHKVVALIAWQQLDQATRTKVVAILKSHPRWKRDFAGEMPAGLSPADQERWVFAQAAIWPDMARDLPQYHHEKWHYINEPAYVNAAAQNALKGKIKVNLKLTWSPAEDEDFQNAPQTVDRAGQTLKSPSTSPRDKALMLSWLFHVVGDLHQPLHTVALFSTTELKKSDFGGNAIELLRSQSDPKPQTLHSFWDRLHGGSLSLTEAGQKVDFILSNSDIPPKAEAAATKLNMKVWVAEGKQICATSVYNKAILTAVAHADSTPEDEREIEVVMQPNEYKAYAQQAGMIANERAAIGGYRLAEILKRTLK